MHTQPTTPTPEVADEALLRATLAECAPATVDAEAAWVAVSSRITATAQNESSAKRRGFRLLRTGAAPRADSRRPFPKVAAVLAVAVLLMGAGFAGAHFFQWSGKAQTVDREHLFTVVNQRQSEQGVTIMVNRAYADPGNTYLDYTIQLSSDLVGRYDHTVVASYDLTDGSADGSEAGAGNTQCGTISDSGQIDCLLDASPFHEGASVTQITITYTITRLYLQHSGNSDTTELSGHWSFQFTIPFHQPSLGPGGPYAQPSAPAR
jgi:hypothetical protein